MRDQSISIDLGGGLLLVLIVYSTPYGGFSHTLYFYDYKLETHVLSRGRIFDRRVRAVRDGIKVIRSLIKFREQCRKRSHPLGPQARTVERKPLPALS